jgi:hypothetical protein
MTMVFVVRLQRLTDFFFGGGVSALRMIFLKWLVARAVPGLLSEAFVFFETVVSSDAFWVFHPWGLFL